MSSSNKGKCDYQKAKNDVEHVPDKSSDESGSKSNTCEPSSSSRTKLESFNKHQILNDESSNDSGSSIEVIPEEEVKFPSKFFLSGDPSCITIPHIQNFPCDERTLPSFLHAESNISRKRAPNETLPHSSSKRDSVSSELEQTSSPDTSFRLKKINLSMSDSEISGCPTLDASPQLSPNSSLIAELEDAAKEDNKHLSPTDPASDNSSFDNISSESSFENVESPSKSRKRLDFSPEY